MPYSKRAGLVIGWIRDIKRLISRSELGARLAVNVQRFIFKLYFKNNKDLFTYYYNTNKWGDKESVSGPGSSAAATVNIRRELPELLNGLNVKKFFDAPCGDFHWFKSVIINPDIEYTGGEIVEEIVEMNRSLYTNSNRKFILFDIVNNELPIVDMWLCRDTLFHFSNSDITKVLFNLKKSKIKYFLSTTYPDIDLNRDITTGDYRPINLIRPPFNLPPPLKYIEDSDAGHIGKKLGLWEL